MYDNHSPGHHRQQTWRLHAKHSLLNTPSTSVTSETFHQGSVGYYSSVSSLPVSPSLCRAVSHDDALANPVLHTCSCTAHNDSGCAADKTSYFQHGTPYASHFSQRISDHFCGPNIQVSHRDLFN